jgi:hypothetical protein
MEISLSVKDFRIMLAWYELVFAGGREMSDEDFATFKKITVMLDTLDEELSLREKN